VDYLSADEGNVGHGCLRQMSSYVFVMPMGSLHPVSW
jgi:hypothetical protein